MKMLLESLPKHIGECGFDKPFIAACLCGDACLDDIDSYIAYWHNHHTGKPLPEFLGMTSYEFSRWIRCGEDSVLQSIVTARRENGAFVLDKKHASVTFPWDVLDAKIMVWAHQYFGPEVSAKSDREEPWSVFLSGLREEHRPAFKLLYGKYNSKDECNSDLDWAVGPEYCVLLPAGISHGIATEIVRSFEVVSSMVDSEGVWFFSW